VIKIGLTLYKVQQNIYLLDFQKVSGDAFSYMTLCANIITELKTLSAASKQALLAQQQATAQQLSMQGGVITRKACQSDVSIIMFYEVLNADANDIVSWIYLEKDCLVLFATTRSKVRVNVFFRISPAVNGIAITLLIKARGGVKKE
jgi:Kinase associated domain 1